ncbi:MAG: VCBS repeat-containing protein, partial [Acidobacteriota bacterium]|nr:VCBS repeat-containing protein [Acidobacteriota bacterium]
MAKKAGLHFQLRNGETGTFRQIELMAGGVAVLDYNNDGCMDIFYTNGAEIPSLRKTGPAYSNRLFRNRCDGTFEDVTSEAGLAGTGYSVAAAAGDFDNDGFTDLFVAGVHRNVLYHNVGGRRFQDITIPAGVGSAAPQWSVSAGWFDYDNDGWLDLFVSNYVEWNAASEPECGGYYCHPSQYKPLANQLFHNDHNGHFTDVSVKSGIARYPGRGMGVAFADADGDGFTDIFVANDSVRSFLFHNL